MSKNSILTKLIWIFASKLFKWFSNNWIFAQKSNFLNMKFWGKCWFEIFWRKKLWFSNTVQVHKKAFFSWKPSKPLFFLCCQNHLILLSYLQKNTNFPFSVKAFYFPLKILKNWKITILHFRAEIAFAKIWILRQNVKMHISKYLNFRAKIAFAKI